MRQPTIFSLAAVLFLCSCASTPPAAPDLAAAGSDVDAARASGAPELAPVEFNEARNKLDRAHSLSVSGDDRRAVIVAQEADVDAQLARARAQAARSERAAREIGASDATLREELDRQATPPPDSAAPPSSGTLQ